MKEINIICIGDIRYRFDFKIIRSWDFDYSDSILRIDFTDGSFIEYYKQNVICVEVCCGDADMRKGETWQTQ